MRYAARRILQSIPVVLVVTFVVFIMLHLIPGDPAQVVAGVYASEADVARVRQRLGLDEPLLVQYGSYMVRLVSGDLGVSVRTGRPVIEILAARWPRSLTLALTSMLLAVVLGIPLGVWAGSRKGTLLDRGTLVLGLIAISTPTFWLGLILILGFSVQFGWFPTYGTGSWKHLVLPSITLAAVPLATIAQLVRTSVVDELGSDYVRTARAKGVSVRSLLFGHVLRNALIPAITFIGLQFGVLMSSAVVTEAVFAWPGLGLLVVDSMLQRDYPVIQALILLFSVLFIGINLLVDLMYAWVDPRMME